MKSDRDNFRGFNSKLTFFFGQHHYSHLLRRVHRVRISIHSNHAESWMQTLASHHLPCVRGYHCRCVAFKYIVGLLLDANPFARSGMAFAKSWESLVVCRALLGIAEAGFFPGCSCKIIICSPAFVVSISLITRSPATVLISTWYTRYETQKRLAVFYLTSKVG